MITVREAKLIAKDWVEREAPTIPNFRGAFLSGSVIWKNEEELHPVTSDVDLKVLVDLDDRESIREKGLIQKYRSYKGTTLETTYSPFQRFASPESVLADFGYAAHFTRPNIISDPSGELTKIQKAVTEQFARKKWVIKRIERVRDIALWGLNSLQSGSFADRMLALWFAMGIGHIPILADLSPPTIRKGPIVLQQVLEKHGRQDLREPMLQLYGSQTMAQTDVERHLDNLTNTFDRTLEIVQSSSMGDYINPIARPIVIDGSWEMINDGFHHEAMIWIVGMRTICQQTILRDAPDAEQKKYTEQYHKLLAELGLHSEDDFQKRAEDGEQLLEEVMQVSEQIMETNERIIE